MERAAIRGSDLQRGLSQPLGLCREGTGEVGCQSYRFPIGLIHSKSEGGESG